MSTLIRALQGMSQGSRKASSVVNKLLTPSVPKTSSQAQSSLITVQADIVQVGTKLRLRKTSDGGVIETLSVDGTVWLPHVTYKQT